ncbi:MAG: SDR family oxidoreductase [Candidatus Lambdaproteobacteria bacterium]|nr:SDR family oxidoreductase [Candidatus Lambdaproteobacteria bacterium]
MAKEFAGQLVVVAGGTGGVGEHVTAKFAELGASLVVPYVSDLEVYTFKATHPEIAETVLLQRVDALDAFKVTECFQRVAEHHGVPDVLVNLVGGYAYGPPVAESDVSVFRRMLDVNFVTTFNLCRCLLPYMLKRGSGKIVNVGARHATHGTSHHAAYAVAKAAVQRLTESISAEVKARGINVNCVLPSIVDTMANRLDFPEADYSRWVTPEDLAEVIVFLASPRARAIHGASIPVYGQM